MSATLKLCSCKYGVFTSRWWRQYTPLKRRSTIILHGSISQKTTLNRMCDHFWPLLHIKLSAAVCEAFSNVCCAMAQAVSHWPLTAEAQVCAQVDPCGICGGQSGTGLVFIRVLWFSHANHHSSIAPYSSITATWGVDGSDKAAHYHTLGPKLGASSLTRHLVGLGVK
jgi:hypothetical protein